MTKVPSNIFGEIPTIMHALNPETIEHKKIIDNLALAVFLVDENLILKYLNPAAEEVIGTGIRHATGRPFTNFFLDVEGNFIGHIKQSITTGHPITEREVCVKRIGGGEMTIDCSITPMLSQDNETVCMLELTQVDRMLRIAREEHLLSETQATQNMLRGLAHEIKNPLGGLRGAAQLLASELSNDELREYTDVIINEADRLRKLVDRMFGPKVTPVKQQINIHDVLEHIRYLAMAEKPNGIQIIADYDPSIPDIYADRDLLIQAILNIMRNAIQAVDEDGEIIIRTRVLRQFTIGDKVHRLVLQTSIIDNGCGIDDEIKSQIFFPMVSGNRDGTGLGLPISQNLINLHDGIIEFDSTPGVTEFHVLLPVNDVCEFKNKTKLVT